MAGCGSDDNPNKPDKPEPRPDPDLVAEGRKIFRFDTFGDEARWTGTLRMHEIIPPAYGLKGIHRITFTGDRGDVTYWNRYVAVTQMGGLGSFSDPRIGVDVRNGDVDLVGPKLPALRAYQLSLEAPPPPGSFNAGAAVRGVSLFRGGQLCLALGDEAVPDRPVARAVAAPAVLPQRHVRHHGGRGKGL